MANRPFTPVLGKRLRITPLDACGTPPVLETAAAVTDGFITLTLSAETEEGSEIITRKANGSMCVNEMTDPSFKRFTVEIEFCGVNPRILAMVTNAEEYADYAGDVSGIVIPEGTIDSRFALEMWSGLSGAACLPGEEEASGYLLLPFVNGGVLGDIEVTGEDAVTFTMTGAFTRGGNGWGVGPFDVMLDETSTAAPLPEPLDPLDHLLLVQTGLTPPPVDVEDPAPVGP